MALSVSALNQKLNLSLPIWQAPLPFSILSAENSAEISHTGALGLLRISAHTNRAKLADMLERYRSLHDHPAVCFMHCLPQHTSHINLTGQTLQEYAERMKVPYPLSQPDHFLDLLDTTIAASPRAIGFANGIPEKDTIEFIKSQDIITFAICHSVLEALAAINFGIDCLVLQGQEAGGEQCHFDNDLPQLRQSGLSLLQQVRHHTDKPLILWGDFAHGADIVSALIAGAQAVMCDRLFVQCFIDNKLYEIIENSSEYHFNLDKKYTTRTMRYLPNTYFPKYDLSSLSGEAKEALLEAYYDIHPEQRLIPISMTSNQLPRTLSETVAALQQQINELIS